MLAWRKGIPKDWEIEIRHDRNSIYDFRYRSPGGAWNHDWVRAELFGYNSAKRKARRKIRKAINKKTGIDRKEWQAI